MRTWITMVAKSGSDDMQAFAHPAILLLRLLRSQNRKKRTLSPCDCSMSCTPPPPDRPLYFHVSSHPSPFLSVLLVPLVSVLSFMSGIHPFRRRGRPGSFISPATTLGAVVVVVLHLPV